DPVADHRLRIRVLDAEHAAQHVDHRMERHRPAERERLALDPRGVAAQAPAQLAQQPRFADPRLPDDRDDLPLPADGELEAVAQETQLALAADEAGAAGFCPTDDEPRARGGGAGE